MFRRFTYSLQIWTLLFMGALAAKGNSCGAKEKEINFTSVKEFFEHAEKVYSKASPFSAYVRYQWIVGDAVQKVEGTYKALPQKGKHFSDMVETVNKPSFYWATKNIFDGKKLSCLINTRVGPHEVEKVKIIYPPINNPKFKFALNPLKVVPFLEQEISFKEPPKLVKGKNPFWLLKGKAKMGGDKIAPCIVKFGKSDFLVREVNAQLGHGKHVFSYLLSNLTPIEVKESDFDYTPPKGVEVVEINKPK